ncbi:MAG: VCBS repeat-containing protein [Bacteroidaceae bacterium]|nr:VCBS repeat-containing protein [Bacteroidaceae bacterium]
MKRLVTMVLSLMLGASLFADNELVVGDINISATVDQIGGASITIPIEVPVGVNDMQPNLALVYNSHSGYGLAGWGWDLAGISSIQRAGKTLYHDSIVERIKFDYTDNLLLDGERLLLQSGTNLRPGAIYRTERESFNLVEMTDDKGFTVQSKTGDVSTYGDTYKSQLTYNYDIPQIWFLSKVVDNNGNFINYTYNYNRFSDVNDTYISKIEYSGDISAPTTSIEFEYEDIPNERYIYVGSSRFSRNKILKCINVKNSGNLLYSYILTYDHADVQSKLISVMKVAANGDYYNATDVTWNTTGTSSEVVSNVSISRKDELIFADFTGDGLTDIFSYKKEDKNCILYTNTSTENAVSFSSTSFSSVENLTEIKVLDYNGDGRKDLAGIYDDTRITYLISNGTTFNTTSNYISAPQEGFSVGDFDGDGCDEIIPTGVNKMYQYNADVVPFTGIATWSNSSSFIHSMSKNNAPLDFNGNGKTDLLIFTDAYYYIYEFDESTSKFKQIGLEVLNSMVENFLSFSKFYFGDFNGDGSTDFLHLGFESPDDYRIMARVFVSRGGQLVEEMKQHIGYTEIFVNDFNNDGISDIAYLANIDGIAHLYAGINNCDEFVIYDQTFNTPPADFNTFFFEDIRGTGRADFVMFNNKSKITTKQVFTNNPMLVDKVTDGMGNTYDFTYKSIANSNVYTNTRVGGGGVLPLVSPFYVVSDYTAPYTSLSYHYKNGRYHTQGKGFFGFEEVTTTDNLNQTRKKDICYLTTAHLCYYPYSTTTTTLDGDTISYLKYRYTVREMGGKRIFPHHSGYEYTDHLTGIKETLVSLYDNNGNLSSATKTRGDWKEISQYQYINAGSWCPNKVNNSLIYNTYNGGTSPYRRTFYKYDNRGNLTRQTIDTLYTDTYRLVKQFMYDSFGNITKEIVSGSGQTRTRTYTYSTDGRFLLTSTDELGQTTTNTYNSDWGTLLTQTTNAGVTKNSYDSFGRLWKAIAPDSVVYTISSQFVSGVPNVRYMAHETRTNSSPVTIYYNAAGKPLFIKKMGHNDRQIYTAYTYFPNGQDKLISEPYFSTSITAAASQTFTSDNATLYTYDECQRPSRMESPEGTTFYTYNGLNTAVNTPTINKAIKLNSSGFTEYEQVGAALMPLAERPGLIPLYKRVYYTYYSTGKVKSATPDGGATVTMQYDVQGNRTKLIDPDAGTITNTYNAFGQVLTRSQNVHGGTPVVTAYSYDASNGRLKSETATGDTVITTTYSYNSTFKDKPYKINGDGGYSYYMYDDFGNATAYQKSYKGKTTRLRSYYDKNLVTKSQMVLANSWVYYTYDAYGNMTTEKFNTTLAWELLEQNARGQVVRERKGGVVTTYTYDNCGRITSIVAPNIVSLHYTYDIHGNVLTKTDAVNNQSIEYTYDHLMRLTSWTVNDNDTQSITYDAATGNIISKSDLGTSTEFSYSSSSKPHALRGVSGITGTDWGVADISIDYTDFSKVKSIQCGTDSYDVFYGVEKERFRTQKTVSGATTIRYYMPNHELVVDSLGHETYIIYLCNGSIAVYDKAAGAKTLYHGYYDAQGSLIALTDNSGNVLARYAYDPWGKRVGTANWAYSPTYTSTLNIDRGYTMHEHLDEFDLINMNGRVYDPAVAQFLSPDPYIQDAGNWLNYNRYAYCYNNPTRYVDPDGEWVHIVIGAVIGGAINVWANQDACDGIGQVMAAFGAGALAGGLTAATGGATSGLLATAGAGIASAAIGGAAVSGVNSVISQTGEGFSGNINWRSVGTSAMSGAVSSGVSAGVSVGMSGFLANKFSYLNSTPALKAGLKEAVAGSVGEYFGAFAGSLVVPKSFEQANSEMLNAAKWGAISGFTTGFMTEGIKQLSLGTPNKQKSNNSIEAQLENQLNSVRNDYYRNEYIQMDIDYKIDMHFTPSFSTDSYEYYIIPTTDPNTIKIINPENPLK